MTDLSHAIVPRSDQQNADDFIAGPRTITITKVIVKEKGAEQPVWIYFEGDENKPYKPCKSMMRVLAMLWGSETKAYIGRRLTLYRDPAITFGKDAVGGIRISHMSQIDGEKKIALTVTRGRRAPFTVQPLKTEKETTAKTKTDPPQGAGDPPAGATLTYAGFEYELSEAPCEIELPTMLDNMEPHELREFTGAFRTLIQRAPEPTRRAWFDSNAAHFAKLKSLNAPLAAKVEAALTIAGSSPSPATGGGPAADGKGAGGPPPPNSGEVTR